MSRPHLFASSVCFCRQFSPALTVLFLLFFLFSSGVAQSGGAGPTPLGRANGHTLGSSKISDIESINYFNGRLNITLPLASIQGRGSVSYPINLNIGSPGWKIEYGSVPDNNGNGGYSPALFATYDPTATIGGFVSLDSRLSYGYVDYDTCYGNPLYQNSVTRMYVSLGDGTEHELRDVLTDGQPMSMGSCLNYSNRGKVFVSKDGSNLKYVSNTDILDSNNYYPTTGTLYLPDGTTYGYDGSTWTTWLKDRNGNISTLGPTSNLNSGISLHKDSAGREVQVYPYYYGPNGPSTAYVKYKGFGGVDRQVSVIGAELSNAFASGESTTTMNQLFPSLQDYGSGNWGFGTYVVSEVALPNGQSYHFKYNRYGDLVRIEFPTGSVVEYTWANGVDGAESSGQLFPGNFSGSIIYRRLIERRIYEDGANLTSRLTVSRPESQPYGTTIINAGYVDVKTYSPSSQLEAFERHYYYGQATNAFMTPANNVTYQDWKTGREYKTEIFSTVDSSVLRQTNRTWQQTAPSWWYCQGCTSDNAPTNNPQLIETTEVLADTNQISKKTYSYDSRNNLTDTYEYDFGVGSPGAFLRRSHTNYLTVNPVNNVDYTSATGIYMPSLPSESWISSDINGSTKVSRTIFEYDNYVSDSTHAALTNRTSTIRHDDSNFGTSFTTRGNVTKTTSYTNAAAQTGAVSSYSQYDVLGNIIKTIDPNGNATLIGYADNFGSPNAEATTNSAPSQLNGYSAFAFPTSTTSSTNWTLYLQYDYSTSQPVNGQDVNGNVSKTIYNDTLDRPTQIVTNVGTSLEKQVTNTYDDTNRKVTITSDLNTLNDNLLKIESFYDRLGRVTETRNYETLTVYRGTQTQYDALNRPYKVSNPFRSGDTLLWTQSYFDSLGRITKVRTPDNAEINTTYSGNSITVTDQAGKSRRSILNAARQMIRIDEPNSGGTLGPVASPSQPTYYKYNALGKMTRVQQGSQNRYFMYDSLGRILRVFQPEQETNISLNTSGNPDNNSWTAGFTYDNNGNVLTTTDAKGTMITSTYDALNRPLTRTYSDGTPTVTNYYDGQGLPSVPNYSKGKLTRVSSGVSDTRYSAFDVAGQLTETKQITDGNTYTSSYQYNLAGALTQETLPSGRVVKNSFSSNGNLSLVERRNSPTGPLMTMASDFSYTADGKIKQLQLGNGLWETAQFNNRLQVTEFGLGTTQGAYNVWRAQYEFGELQTNGSVDVSKNSGNIAKQTVSFSGLANSFVQAYKYDSLDRITEAKETVNGNQTWIQNWGYDRYGNRSSFSQNVFGYTTVSNPSISTTTNRFNSGQGYLFDKNGNVTVDNSGYEVTYNGDNKQTQVVLPQGKGGLVTLGTYYYDGEGKRVKKTTYTGDNVIFVYANGKLVEERNASTNAVQTTYIYAGSQLLATETGGTTNYTATDQLGSPRIITDQNGAVVSRRDFMPFGEELFPDGTYRKTADKYSSSGQDVVRQRFTGYQKDIETGLDFAEARMYQNQHGRFTAIDPLLASGKSANPQTFNRYVYTMNRPLILTDSTGMQSGKVVTGTTYYNPTTDTYQIGPGDGFKKYDGPGWSDINRAGHYINMRQNGWTDYGKAEIDNGGAHSAPDGLIHAVGKIIRAIAPSVQAYADLRESAKDPGVQAAMVASVGGAPIVADELEAEVAASIDAALADEALIVRGGVASAENLSNGSGVATEIDGTLSGVSVRSANGLTEAELAAGGEGAMPFPNGQISVTTAGQVRAAGGTVRPDLPTNLANPYHCEICGVSPDDLAHIFVQKRNPVRP